MPPRPKPIDVTSLQDKHQTAWAKYDRLRRRLVHQEERLSDQTLVWMSVESRLAHAYLSKQHLIRTKWIEAHLGDLDAGRPGTPCWPPVMTIPEPTPNKEFQQALSDDQLLSITLAYQAAQDFDGIPMNTLHEKLNTWENIDRPALISNIDHLKAELDEVYADFLTAVNDKTTAWRAIKTAVESLESDKKQICGELSQPNIYLPLNMQTYPPVIGVTADGRLETGAATGSDEMKAHIDRQEQEPEQDARANTDEQPAHPVVALKKLGRRREYEPGRCTICPPEKGEQDVSLRFVEPACSSHVKCFGKILTKYEASPDHSSRCTPNRPCYVCSYEVWIALGFRKRHGGSDEHDAEHE